MHVTPKKRLGQHFLIDMEIAEKIVHSLQFTHTPILEIGAGTGVLTRFLMTQAKNEFKVVEIDAESIEYLQQHYPELKENLIRHDFLQLDIASLFSEPFAIIGNFPYNISSQILFKILDNKDVVTEVVGMFQKEVAERIVADPGTKQYGILSVLLQAFYDIEYLFTVDESKFLPPPKVKSAVIRMQRNPDKKLRCNEVLFKKVVKLAFNQRRKMLRNSLKSLLDDVQLDNPAILNLRPEQLSVAEFEKIVLNIEKKGVILHLL